MCVADRCFKRLHREIIINGSVGDDLKVDKADEFDWDIVLELPECIDPFLTFSNVPGYVHVECELPRNLPRAYRYRITLFLFYSFVKRIIAHN